MALHEKAFREDGVVGETHGAIIEAEDLAAFLAGKVMVVVAGDLREFVAQLFVGQVDFAELTRFEEELYRPVDGRHADLCQLGDGELVNLGHGERSAGRSNDLKDDFPLARVAAAWTGFHDELQI